MKSAWLQHTGYEEILHTAFNIASPRIEGILLAASKVSRTPTIYEVSRGRVPTILLPGSNTFFFARIPDIPSIFSTLHAVSRGEERGGGRSTDPRGVRTNQSFATADPHKFFHADSPATEHATESWITMSGITFRLLLDLTGFTSATSARLASRTIDFHPRSTPFNTVADKEEARTSSSIVFYFKVWNLIRSFRCIEENSFVFNNLDGRRSKIFASLLASSIERR